ncbi:MAG: EamA family transporter [Deltaproteobacteria bacterium]|nr:EamA family transporter [Deltaproteobacteria bacterium]
MMYGYFLAFLAAALWGLNYSLDQRALAALSVWQLYFLHSVFGVIITALISICLRHPLTDLFMIDSTVISPRLLGATLLVGTAAGLAIFGSVSALGASKASILEISYPFFVALFSYLIFGESIKGIVLLGGLMMFLGAAIIVKWG